LPTCLPTYLTRNPDATARGVRREEQVFLSLSLSSSSSTSASRRVRAGRKGPPLPLHPHHHPPPPLSPPRRIRAERASTTPSLSPRPSRTIRLRHFLAGAEPHPQTTAPPPPSGRLIGPPPRQGEGEVWSPVFSPACSSSKDLHPRPWAGIHHLNRGGDTLALRSGAVDSSRFPQRHPLRVPRESRGGGLLRGMHLRVRFGAICPFCMPLNNETIIVTSIPLFGEDKHYYYG
jgi:hypothetical protein